jgi:hypothetical protein
MIGSHKQVRTAKGSHFFPEGPALLEENSHFLPEHDQV